MSENQIIAILPLILIIAFWFVPLKKLDKKNTYIAKGIFSAIVLAILAIRIAKFGL